MGKLPSYFHNINNRVAMSNTLERTIRNQNYSGAPFLDPKTTLEKKSFRVDHLNPKPKVFDP